MELMENGLVIRRMEERDLDAVMEIWLQANLDAHSFVDPSYWRENAPSVREAIGKAEVLVAGEKETVTGFLGITGDYIAGLFVKRDCRSRGIGKALLEQAKAGHPGGLTLEVYQRNPRAVSFYLREGFGIKEKKTDPETREPEYLMAWLGA